MKPNAELELEVDGTVVTAKAEGDGPVDAIFNAIRSAFPHEVVLRLYSVGAVTEGTDAQARVTVRLEEGGKMVDANGRTGMVNVWGKRSNWVDYTAEVDGERLGVAIAG